MIKIVCIILVKLQIHFISSCAAIETVAGAIEFVLWLWVCPSIIQKAGIK